MGQKYCKFGGRDLRNLLSSKKENQFCRNDRVKVTIHIIAIVCETKLYACKSFKTTIKFTQLASLRYYNPILRSD